VSGSHLLPTESTYTLTPKSAPPRMRQLPDFSSHSEKRNWSETRLLVKYTLERILATFLLILVAPLFAVISVAILLSSGGPVLTRDLRLGRYGKPFNMLKFRTAVHATEDGPLYDSTPFLGAHMLSKPQLTPIGSFLRETSLAELPRLLNVLSGSMSLVGPHPALPSEVHTYNGEAYRRFRVKPGLTGLSQINRNSGLSWEERTQLDLYYVDNCSPSLDLMILVKTLSSATKA
jgi:lipopolysaccharide/colanic/teichoic acid biosynthesis glycosyltransferase